jgi:hypothetical protein
MVCTGTPVTCTALSQCHEAGVCDKNTGQCARAFKASGAACDDASRCTTGDKCDGSGGCVGAPVSCPAGDECKTGMCDPSTGMCAMPPKIDGTACNDGSLCTRTDKCRAGVCVGENPVVCTPELCRDAGTCVASTGACSKPNKPDGTMCGPPDDKCLLGKCAAGECAGMAPKTCSSGNECQTAGTCNKASGQCEGGTKKPDGTGCSDDDMCTDGDACQNGLCKGTAKTCEGQGGCVGVCAPGSGKCEFAVGSKCKNDATCATGEVCKADGSCEGTKLACRGETDCWTAEPCDPVTDTCGKWNPKPATTACTDGDPCTEGDHCMGGRCMGSAKTCAPLGDSAQCQVNACVASSGMCTPMDKVDGATCDDGDKCTTGDSCSSGTCRPGKRKSCEMKDQCHKPTCDPATGECSKGEPLTGTDCEDGNPCTHGETCLAGICVGGLPVLCADTSLCTNDRCEPAPEEPTGYRCVHTPIDNCPVPGVGMPPPQ